MKLSLTTAGLDFLLKSLQGGPSPEFCKIVFGKGTDAGSNATELSTPVKEIDICSIMRKEDYVSIVGVLNNAEITERFKATELGVYIKDESSADGVTLYAYGYSPEEQAALIPSASDYLIETEETIMVYVGSVEDVKAVLSDSSLFASKAIVDKMKETVDVLTPPIVETEPCTGMLPGKEAQFQDTATIIDGFYLDCKRGVFSDDSLVGVVAAEGCSLAVIPVQAGEKYTIFFPGVTSIETTLNALLLKTTKQLFLGFTVLHSNYELDINSIDGNSLNSWIIESEKLLDGYSDCSEKGTANLDKVNSGYYFSFAAPENSDSVVFNIALSENADAKKVYDYKNKFLFFKGFYSELPSGEIQQLYQLGDYVIKDLEGRNLIDGLNMGLKQINAYVQRENISDSFIESHTENSMLNVSNVNAYKSSGVVAGSVEITGSFPEASGEDLEWTINNLYVPLINFVDLNVIPKSSTGTILPSDLCSAYICDGKLVICPHQYGFDTITICFNYMV